MAKKKATRKRPGQPSKIEDEMSIRFAAYLAGEGRTDKQIAEKLGVTPRTIDNWKKAEPEFFLTLKSEKEKADKVVEDSLYSNAQNQFLEEEKAFYDSERGEVVKTTIKKEVRGNVSAQIFWLKNRQPKKWRDRVEEPAQEIDDIEFEDKNEK